MLLPAGDPGRSLARQIRTAPPRVCPPPSSTLATSHPSDFPGGRQRPYPRPPPTHASAAPQTFSARAVLTKAGSGPLALVQLEKLGQTVRCLERGPQLHSGSPWPSPLTSGVHGSWDRPQARSLEAEAGDGRQRSACQKLDTAQSSGSEPGLPEKESPAPSPGPARPAHPFGAGSGVGEELQQTSCLPRSARRYQPGGLHDQSQTCRPDAQSQLPPTAPGAASCPRLRSHRGPVGGFPCSQGQALPLALVLKPGCVCVCGDLAPARLSS